MWKELLNLLRSDDLLQQAWSESHEMLVTAQEMTLEAMRVLRQEDIREVPAEIRAKDKLVNRYERDVRRKVMTHCVVRGSSDLSSGMVLVSIVIDIERIGDYSKNIMDLAVAHPNTLVIPEFEDRLRAIEATVVSRFRDTIEVLESHDVKRAQELVETYKEEVSVVCDGMVDSIVKGEVMSLSPSDAAATVLYVRFLKRIGAHLKNVTTCIVHPFEWIGFRKAKGKDE